MFQSDISRSQENVENTWMSSKFFVFIRPRQNGVPSVGLDVHPDVTESMLLRLDWCDSEWTNKIPFFHDFTSVVWFIFALYPSLPHFHPIDQHQNFRGKYWERKNWSFANVSPSFLGTLLIKYQVCPVQSTRPKCHLKYLTKLSVMLPPTDLFLSRYFSVRLIDYYALISLSHACRAYCLFFFSISSQRRETFIAQTFGRTIGR